MSGRTSDALAREVERLDRARDAVVERIERACARVGRDPDEVTLVAVSKGVPVERLRAALDAGVSPLGENRIQEAEAKAGELPGVSWHLVGHLQANKTRRAARLFDVIHSVDSVDLARRLDAAAGDPDGTAGEGDARESDGESEAAARRLRVDLHVDVFAEARRLPVYLQVNVDADPRKSGFRPDALEGVLADLAQLRNLRLRGLMTIGRLVATPEDARPTFEALRRLSERLRHLEPRLGNGLSMGMSDDFEVAVEEGATVVRVGRAIFGERPPDRRDVTRGPGAERAAKPVR